MPQLTARRSGWLCTVSILQIRRRRLQQLPDSTMCTHKCQQHCCSNMCTPLTACAPQCHQLWVFSLTAFTVRVSHLLMLISCKRSVCEASSQSPRYKKPGRIIDGYLTAAPPTSDMLAASNLSQAVNCWLPAPAWQLLYSQHLMSR